MSKHRNGRSGISLFEVLISILVAAIGVLGVLVLVPFAARNAQLGIDRESSINAAKNFNADFQAYGYQTPFGWYDNLIPAVLPIPEDRNRQVPADPLSNGPAVVSQPYPPATTGTNNIAFGWPYIIDPVGALANEGISGDYDRFPRSTVAFPLPDTLPRINIANILDPNAAVPPNGIGLALARQLSMQPDDLKFDDPATELGPPRQIYYSIDSDSQAKRQFDGRYSTISFVIPDDDSGFKYRMYTIVGKAGDRNAERVFEVIEPDPTVAALAPDMMRIVKRDLPIALPDGIRNFEQIGLGGGDLRLSELPTAGQPELGKDQIRNNDWFMLISYNRTAAVESTFDDIQIDFHRVIHADRTSPLPDATPAIPNQGIVRGAGGPERTYSVTLQGSDFDLYRDWNFRPNNQPTMVPTYAILIPNILAVYERTFRVEPDSTWQSN